MTLKEYDVLGLDSVTVDFVGTIERWPAEGAKQPLEKFAIHDGGLVGTALIAVARLGGRAVFAGKLGTSELSKRALLSFEKDGVDISFVIRENEAEPTVAFVYVNTVNGQRNIFWTYQNVQYPMPNELPDTKWHTRTRVLLIDHESGKAGVQMAEIAKLHKIPIVSDVEGINVYTADIMALSTHLVVSEDFAKNYAGSTNINEMLTSFRTRPEQTIVITRGSRGSVGLGPEGDFCLPAYNVGVVDTTGCGDTFHGAYALAIARKMKVIDAAKFASAAAALCATKIGGREGIPNAEQLALFIRNNHFK
jgi:sulfofructose kinase